MARHQQLWAIVLGGTFFTHFQHLNRKNPHPNGIGFDWFFPAPISGMPSKRKCCASNKIVAGDPAPTSLPTENEAILEGFDRLLRSGFCMPFIRDQPDNKDSTLRWDIVGDAQRNWLYVVVTKAGTKLRFGKVTDDPGGFSIGSQRFGIDAETSAIAGEMADELFREHQRELAR